MTIGLVLVGISQSHSPGSGNAIATMQKSSGQTGAFSPRPPQLPCVMPATADELRPLLRESDAVVQGTAEQVSVYPLPAPYNGEMQTDFLFRVQKVISGTLSTDNGLIHVVEIGSVASILPIGVQHILFLGAAPALHETQAYAIREGLHGRFIIAGGLVSLECVDFSTHAPMKATGPNPSVDAFVSMIQQAAQ